MNVREWMQRRSVKCGSHSNLHDHNRKDENAMRKIRRNRNQNTKKYEYKYEGNAAVIPICTITTTKMKMLWAKYEGIQIKIRRNMNNNTITKEMRQSFQFARSQPQGWKCCQQNTKEYKYTYEGNATVIPDQREVCSKSRKLRIIIESVTSWSVY